MRKHPCKSFRILHRTLPLAVALVVSAELSVIAQGADQTDIYTPDGYTLQTIATPEGVEFQIAGLTTCADNKVYVAIRLGEVWSLDNSTPSSALDAPQWQKFADGINEPTGLMCEDDGTLLVAQKPELTRLIDTDQDGVADEYINFANGWDFHDNYHEYNFGPVKDNQGNYFGTLNLSHGKPEAFSIGAMGSTGGYRGWAYKVTPEGEFSPYAMGLRSPAGIGASPSGEIFYTDNQGDWVATSKMHIVEEGKFYGHPVSLGDHPDYSIETINDMVFVEGIDPQCQETGATDCPLVTTKNFDALAAITEDPVVWIPHVEVGNSPGNPEWDTTGGAFGPFVGQIFVGDQTQSNVFRVLMEKVDGKNQGAVINFMSGFQSGNIRTHFDDFGALWVGQTTGGWAAKGGKPFGLQRVVWDGKTMPFELLDIKSTPTGFTLTFTEAVDPETVAPSSFSAQEWHYLYHDNYGSPKQEEKELPVGSVMLKNDGKTVAVSLPMTAGKVVSLTFRGVRSETGRRTSVDQVYYTLNEVPK